jgi:hypothetical protein
MRDRGGEQNEGWVGYKEDKEGRKIKQIRKDALQLYIVNIEWGVISE